MANPVEGVAALDDTAAVGFDLGPFGVVPDSTWRDPRRAQDAARASQQECRWPHVYDVTMYSIGTRQ